MWEPKCTLPWVNFNLNLAPRYTAVDINAGSTSAVKDIELFDIRNVRCEPLQWRRRHRPRNARQYSWLDSELNRVKYDNQIQQDE